MQIPELEMTHVLMSLDKDLMQEELSLDELPVEVAERLRIQAQRVADFVQVVEDLDQNLPVDLAAYYASQYEGIPKWRKAKPNQDDVARYLLTSEWTRGTSYFYPKNFFVTATMSDEGLWSMLYTGYDYLQVREKIIIDQSCAGLESASWPYKDPRQASSVTFGPTILSTNPFRYSSNTMRHEVGHWISHAVGGFDYLEREGVLVDLGAAEIVAQLGSLSGLSACELREQDELPEMLEDLLPLVREHARDELFATIWGRNSERTVWAKGNSMKQRARVRHPSNYDRIALYLMRAGIFEILHKSPQLEDLYQRYENELGVVVDRLDYVDHNKQKLGYKNWLTVCARLLTLPFEEIVANVLP